MHVDGAFGQRVEAKRAGHADEMLLRCGAELMAPDARAFHNMPETADSL
jgi:hypothetical protein